MEAAEGPSSHGEALAVDLEDVKAEGDAAIAGEAEDAAPTLIGDLDTLTRELARVEIERDDALGQMKTAVAQVAQEREAVRQLQADLNTAKAAAARESQEKAILQGRLQVAEAVATRAGNTYQVMINTLQRSCQMYMLCM
jgi:chromosome segregation ATPase